MGCSPEGKKIGGAPANFAYHVSQFGLDSMAVSAIGEDALGAELLANFDEKGVKYHIDTVPYPTEPCRWRLIRPEYHSMK